MTPDERTARWLDDLDAALAQAEELVARGRDAASADPAIPLAFEALVNRVGDLAKRLLIADPARFADPSWRAVARTRDFVVHHYDRIDLDLLWQTVSIGFPRLRELLHPPIPDNLLRIPQNLSRPRS